eukprot:GDKI01040510.1.p1 GENE.GDKI01040510.1~~GDKI01040510.1.p1  ORF type:complete len:220 (-),score=72.16 GDKI01040510.1:37-696(-)
MDPPSADAATAGEPRYYTGANMHIGHFDVDSGADIWIFGYASLIWKPEPDFVEGKDCVLPGYHRRFIQASPDHRGTPESPGRVCSLVPTDDPKAAVHGVAYRLNPHTARKALEELLHREKAGYSCFTQTVVCGDGAQHQAYVFTGNSDNEFWVGGECIEKTAEVIRHSVGPSGANIAYFRQLLEAMRQRGVVDEHLETIDALIRGTEEREKGGSSVAGA